MHLKSHSPNLGQIFSFSVFDVILGGELDGVNSYRNIGPEKYKVLQFYKYTLCTNNHEFYDYPFFFFSFSHYLSGHPLQAEVFGDD